MKQLVQGISVQGALRKAFYLKNPVRSVLLRTVLSLRAWLTYSMVLLELKQRSGFDLERGEKDEAAVCDACGGG